MSLLAPPKSPHPILPHDLSLVLDAIGYRLPILINRRQMAA